MKASIIMAGMILICAPLVMLAQPASAITCVGTERTAMGGPTTCDGVSTGGTDIACVGTYTTGSGGGCRGVGV